MNPLQMDTDMEHMFNETEEAAESISVTNHLSVNDLVSKRLVARNVSVSHKVNMSS